MTPRLVVILDRAGARLPIEFVAAAAIAGGADIIQVREKERPTAEVREIVKRIVAAVGGPEHVSVNSFPKVAITEQTHLHLADGFRTGLQTDVLAPGRQLSRSIHIGFNPGGLPSADYFILGNLYETGSKAWTPGLGSERFRAAACSVEQPVLAIGGIEPGNVQLALDSWAYGVAVRSFIIGSDDPKRATQEIRNEIDIWMNRRWTEFPW